MFICSPRLQAFLSDLLKVWASSCISILEIFIYVLLNCRSRSVLTSEPGRNYHYLKEKGQMTRHQIVLWVRHQQNAFVFFANIFSRYKFAAELLKVRVEKRFIRSYPCNSKLFHLTVENTLFLSDGSASLIKRTVYNHIHL